MFDSTASTAEVFDGICKPLVDHVFDGFNACSFAYGQTGSGKTYTIFGKVRSRLSMRFLGERTYPEVSAPPCSLMKLTQRASCRAPSSMPSNSLARS